MMKRMIPEVKEVVAEGLNNRTLKYFKTPGKSLVFCAVVL